MAAIGLTDVATQAGTPKINRVEASDASGQRFSAAMEKANTTPSAEVQPIDEAAKAVSTKTAIDPSGTATAEAAERARRTLNLDPSHAAQSKPSHGDSILHGLQKLSGTFAAQEARITNLMSRPAADTSTLIAMQVEVTKFSALVDLTSKLTGKSAQALESLLKGQ